MRARKHDGLRQMFQVFDEVGQGLELDASFRNSFRHKRLDLHRSHECNRRRSHKLSNLDQTEVFGGGRNVEQNTVEFSPVDQIQGFACSARDRYVVVPQVQILKNGLINRGIGIENEDLHGCLPGIQTIRRWRQGCLSGN